MQDEVVDRMSLRSGPEEGGGRRQAAERALQVRAVPRRPVVTAVEGREEMRAEVHTAWFISPRALAQPSGDESGHQRKRPENVVAGRARPEDRANEEETVDPNAGEHPHGDGASAHGRADR